MTYPVVEKYVFDLLAIISKADGPDEVTEGHVLHEMNQCEVLNRKSYCSLHAALQCIFSTYIIKCRLIELRMFHNLLYPRRDFFVFYSSLVMLAKTNLNRGGGQITWETMCSRNYPSLVKKHTATEAFLLVRPKHDLPREGTLFCVGSTQNFAMPIQ